jgi:hypothetical protein
MSVNLQLWIKVSGYDAGRAEAVKAAIRAVFKQEQIDGDFPPLEESMENGTPVLASRTDPDNPLIISGSYRWIPEVQSSLAAAVEQANGGPCEVEFDGYEEGIDEDEPEETDDDDESEGGDVE